jgi:hypothetical protein
MVYHYNPFMSPACADVCGSLSQKPRLHDWFPYEQLSAFRRSLEGHLDQTALRFLLSYQLRGIHQMTSPLWCSFCL